ncbi:DUF3883 domain-containing protein [Cellulophaga baltica]|uniref:DUF3883 domain-containing protein n=1 Tax=Cellulophaga baltica TaxID=76594 RepID=UPI000416A03D|nr:DUF3883 domain-containing protein [Cellulophaga baltica]
MTEKFIYWLENEYDYGKYSKPLKKSSAKSYVSGINSINKHLSLVGNGVYDKSTNELILLRDEIGSIENKDRKSHFEALIKFRERYEKNEKVLSNNSISRQQDVLKKQKVEQIAVNTTIEYYRDLGYNVSSKETDNLGWDLEAMKEEQLLRIEVKGLSGKNIDFEFSPNEFSKSKEYSESFVITVVTNCLEFPILHNFRFNQTESVWKDRFNNQIEIKEIIGARMQIKK